MRAKMIGLLALATGAIACAEKTLSPNSPELSPRFSLHVSTGGSAAAAALGQKLAVGAIYFSSELDPENDSLRILDTALVPVTGATQNVTLKVDITKCLLDPSRRGSHDACSIYIAVFLEPESVTNFDDITKNALDYVIAGPFDVTPGHPPTVPAMDLHSDALVVSRWETDPALQLAGTGAPQGTNAPIVGVPGTGTAQATLFAVAYGGDTAQRVSSPGQFQSGPQLAINSNGAWRRVQGPASTLTSGTGQPLVQFNDIAALAANDVYIAASNGLYHYDGASITAVSNVTDNLRSIAVSPAASGARVLIAGSQTGAVWFGTPGTMARSTFGITSQVDAVCANSATEAFAMNRSNGVVYRFDGTSWTPTTMPFTSSRTDLQCLGPGQAFVFNQGSGTNAMLKWTGSGWSAAAGPAAPNRNMDWAVVSAAEIYAVGDSGNTNRAFYRFDGSTWREIGRLSVTNGLQTKPWPDPRGAMYVISNQNSSVRVEIATATGARVVSYRPSLRDAVMPTTSSAFVVGTNMLLARLNGLTWTVDAPPANSPTNQTLQGVWAESPNNAWAVGTGSAILHWDGARWQTLSDANKPISTTDNYSTVWGAGGVVWIAGSSTLLRCTSTTSCAPQSLPTNGPILNIWGTSASNVYAVGSAGRVFHFDGTSWSTVSVPTTLRLSRIGGDASNHLIAVGDSVVLSYDGAKWTNITTSVLGNQFGFGGQQLSFELGFWAPSAKEIYIGSPFGMRRRTFDWDTPIGPFDSFGRVNAIAGAAGGCAIAVSDGANTFATAMLLRGVGPACNASPFTPPSSWP